MSKLCEYCGAELNGTEKVCPKCGAPTAVKEAEKNNASTVTETVDNSVNYEQTAQVNNTKKGGVAIKIIIALIIVAIIAGVTILVVNIFGNSYKKPIDYFCEALEKGDSKKFLKIYPDIMVEDMDDDDKENMEETLESAKESFEDKYGEKIKVSFKETKKKKMDKDELKEGQETLEDEYKKGKKTKVTAGYTITGNLTIKGKDDSETFEDLEIVIAKVGGKWCMMVDPLTAMMVNSLNGLDDLSIDIN